MCGNDEVPKKSNGSRTEGGSRLWGWFWVVVATAAMYLLVWVTR